MDGAAAIGVGSGGNEDASFAGARSSAVDRQAVAQCARYLCMLSRAFVFLRSHDRVGLISIHQSSATAGFGFAGPAGSRAGSDAGGDHLPRERFLDRQGNTESSVAALLDSGRKI